MISESSNTKYVLHGGETLYGLDDSPNFFCDLLSGTEKSNVSILLVYFARPENQWTDLSHDDMENFNKNTDQQCDFTVASYDNFIDEIGLADIIFFKGGDGPTLIDAIKNYPGFTDAIKGKSLGGTSAGANLFSKYFYSLRGQRVLPGLGILSIKLFTHYREHYVDEYNLLKNHNNDVSDVLCLREGEHVVINI